MNTHSLDVLITLFTLILVTAQANKSEEGPRVHNYLSSIPQYKIKDHGLKASFNNMILAVIKSNEERLQLLKKMNDLPQIARTNMDPIIAYVVPEAEKYTKNSKIELSGDQYVSRGEPHTKSSVLGLKAIKEAEAKHDNKITPVDIENLRNDIDMLRSWKSCKNSAVKACTKACERSWKDICSDYNCGRSFKKEGKRNCKKHCKAEFKLD